MKQAACYFKNSHTLLAPRPPGPRRRCVMVPDPNLDKALHAGADQVLESLLQFRPEEWGLPPFDDDAGPAAGA